MPAGRSSSRTTPRDPPRRPGRALSTGRPGFSCFPFTASTSRTPEGRVLFPEEDPHDQAGRADAKCHENKEKHNGTGPAEVVRPADPASERDEQGRVFRVEVQPL